MCILLNPLSGSTSARSAGALLRLSQGSYETAIVARGTRNRVLAMDLDGFFSRVFLAFFKADADAEVRLSDRHTVLDLAITGPGAGGRGALRAEAGFLRRALRLIREHGVCILQANDPYLSGFNAFLLSRLARVPYVVEVVSDYDLSHRVAGKRTMPYLPSRAAEKRVERLVLRRADAVYAHCDYYLRCALANGARRERSHRVRAVTDPFHYSAVPEKPLSAYVETEGRRVLLYVGRLSGEKYPLDLVDCLARVRAAGEDVLLLLAGDGDLRDAVRGRARELDLERQVVLLGNRPVREVVDLMHGADVLLATHAGYSLIEAALSRTPIVAYDYEWHPEIVRDGETGLLAPYRDTDAMAAAALRLLREQRLGQRLGDAARRFVLERHDGAGAKEDERRIYQRLLGM